MRILLVHNFYKIPGGEDSVFKNEEKLLKTAGHEVYTYTKDNRDMGFKDLLFDALYSPGTYRDVRQLIRDKGIELVHVHNDRFLISPSVYKAAKDENIPVVRTLHNFRMICINAMLTRKGRVCTECLKEGCVRCFPALKYACFRNSRLLTLLSLRINRNAEKKHLYDNVKFIALTEFNRNIFIHAGFKAENIFVKPNFTFADNPGGRETAPSEKKDFLFLGRIDPLKGIEDILKEWAKLPEEYVLNIAGTGDSDVTARLQKEYALKNVHFLGSLDHEEAMALLSESKAMIFASRLYEGIPMVIIESFFMGTPVIGVDFGNSGSIMGSIYSNINALMKDISCLGARIRNFDRDLEEGLYDYDRAGLSVYGPAENLKILTEIYEKCLTSR